MKGRRIAARLAVIAVLGVGAAVIALFVLDAQRGRLGHGLVPAPGVYDVRILRDVRGVPHILGATDADVAYGLAWAHAEDDFPTLQGALLAARGQLASVYGADAAPNDFMVHLLRIDDVVEAGYRQLPQDVRDLCEGYADGLNHYAALHADEAHAELYPVRGADVVRGFVHKLPLFFGIDGVLGELFAEGDTADSTANDGEGETTRGSNVIAIAPSRTPDGSTLLVVNSHQPWEGPVAWYEAHLKSDEGWDMVGGVFPGAPLILHGHNRQLGWAHTVNRPDLIDLYRLETDPDDPTRYRFDGEWFELEERKAPIEVKLWGPIRWTFERTVYWSEHHGPAVVRENGPDAGTYALRFAGFGDVRAVEQWYRMNRATHFEAWRDAMAMGALPMFNTGYADRDGRIFYVYNARLPSRTPGFDYAAQGLAGALPGDISATVWGEPVPFDTLPQVLDPPSGFIQNANSSPLTAAVGRRDPEQPEPSLESLEGSGSEGDPAASSPRPVALAVLDGSVLDQTWGVETEETNRSLRLRTLLAKGAISWQRLETIKFDTRYNPESVIAGWRQRLLDEREVHEANDPELAVLFDHLAAWDLDTDSDNPHTALPVMAWGDLLLPDQSTPTEDELLERLRNAATTLRQHHGDLAVPWGEVNRLRRGEVDLPLAGGPDVVHAVYGEPTEDGRLRGWAGDSYILMVQWAADGTITSKSLHQYGSATLDETSPHYADRAEPFANRQLQDVWLDEADIRANLEREYRPGDG